jgi:nucleotide-binding universal stress UspA family protein
VEVVVETSFPSQREPRRPEYVVGVDGSLASVAAARWAADRAVRDGALLTVVHAYAVPSVPSVAGPIRTPAFRRMARQDAERLLRSVVKQLPVVSELQQQAEEGAADRILLEHSERSNLLVLGARPRHNHPHARFIGSTAARCLRGAQCPVVVVPGESFEAPTTAPGTADKSKTH